MRFGDDNEELDAFKQCIFIGRKRAAKKMIHTLTIRYPISIKLR